MEVREFKVHRKTGPVSHEVKLPSVVQSDVTKIKEQRIPSQNENPQAGEEVPELLLKTPSVLEVSPLVHSEDENTSVKSSSSVSASVLRRSTRVNFTPKHLSDFEAK